MKILQVIPFFTPVRGGSVIVPYNLSRELAKIGHDVTIITTDFEFDNDYANSIRNSGVKVIPFHCIVNISMLLISPSIKKWLNSNINHYDLIHMHNFRSYQNNAVLHYAKKYNVPYVLQAHGSLPYFAKQNLKKLYDFVWGNKILHNASRVIALHKTEADQYKKMGVVEEKIDVISNGIDLSEYERLPERGQFRKRYNIKDNEKIILYLGRIHKSKGIDLLIAAYSELIKDLKDSKLVIVGPDDGHLSELKNQTTELGIEDKVLFTGPLFNRDKLTAFVDADVFVTPKFSGLPVTFIEACACGLPIITTTEGDDIDWINNNVGFVVEYSVSSISQSIVKLLQDDKLQSRFGNKGKDLVRNELNWGRISKCFEELYSSLCRVI